MCGIIGYISIDEVVGKILEGLSSLEYRGYDSCGICLVNNNQIYTYKSLKRVSSLSSMINKSSNCAIAHTRWATHGKPNLTNCHPISSANKQFSIIHNGIIHNYESLKNDLLKDFKFTTNTDTEVIANAIAYFSNENTLLEALRLTYQTLEGSFACLIIDNQDNDKIYFMKNKSPLLIAKASGYYLSSDILSLPDNTESFYRLNDGELGYVTSSQMVLYDSNHRQIIPTLQKYQKQDNNLSLGNFHHYMEKEIYDQPYILNSYLQEYFCDNELVIKAKLSKLLNKASKIYLIGSGSSYHSALLGAYFFNHLSKIESNAFLASEFDFDNYQYANNSMFIAISQSGETADLIKAIEKIKVLGFPILSLTNSLTSTIANMADYNIDIKAGFEVAVASTKAYTASTTILCILANCLSQNNQPFLYDYKQAIIAMNYCFANINQIKKLAIEVASCEDLFFLGKGLDYYLSSEGSLKLKEISYIHCESFAAGELKHGTLALINDNSTVIALITQSKYHKAIRSNIEEVKSRGGKVITIVSSHLKTENDNIVIPETKDYLSFIPTAIVFQLFAYYVALQRGNNIDKPRNLAKSVTVE